MTKETILILYSNYGDGHRQAAKALRDTLAMTQHNMEGILVDFMELTHPHVYPMSRYLFIQAMKKSPSIYGYIFNKTRDVNSFSNLMKKFNGLGLGRLLSFIQTARPSMIVSTFPLAAGAMSKLKEFGLTDVPTTTVITDHTDHSAWVHPYTDHYIAGSEFVKQALQRNHISNQQITVTGIPIRREFNGSFNRESLLGKHDLDPSRPTLLIMGGAYGLLDGSYLDEIIDYNEN
jgi:processive 1,2-diacylglycerol beta-glucosyltransferase